MTVNAEQFRDMMREELDGLIGLSLTKGRDYAGEEDALRHFKEHAREYGVRPEQVWAVFAGKHWSAVLSAIRHTGDDGYIPSEPVEGRIRDLILYLFLLMALLREEDFEDAPASQPEYAAVMAKLPASSPRVDGLLCQAYEGFDGWYIAWALERSREISKVEGPMSEDEAKRKTGQ